MNASVVPLHIGIDGLNLAIPRGTSIATYTRSLSHCIGELEHAVDVIYGLNILRSADPILKEVLFFDFLESDRGRKVPKFPSVKWAAQMIQASCGMHAFEIDLTGRTISTQLGERLPR